MVETTGGYVSYVCFFFFFSSRRRHTRLQGDWSSVVCSSDLVEIGCGGGRSCVPYFFADAPSQPVVFKVDLFWRDAGVRGEPNQTVLGVPSEIGRASCRERV